MAVTLYWRVEWHPRDIMSEPHLSTGWGDDGGGPTTANGLSCFESASGLLTYFERWIEDSERIMDADPDLDEEEEAMDGPGFDPETGRRLRPHGRDYYDAVRETQRKVQERQHRIPTEDSRVVVFVGEQIGTCIDGYPLAIPSRVVLETTYGVLRDHDCLDWFDGASSADLARILTMETVRPSQIDDWDERDRYLIGPMCVRMTDAEAERWNTGCTTEDDEQNVPVYDADCDEWVRLGDALIAGNIGRWMEGEYAVREDGA